MQTKDIRIFKTTTMKMAGVKYGKYAHLVPDVVTYLSSTIECFSFQ